MENAEELNELYAEQNSLESSKSSLENRITRLQYAKEQVDSLGKRVANLPNASYNNSNESEDFWTGSQRDLHMEYISTFFVKDLLDYLASIHSLSDSISDEIRRLDWELLDTVGLLEWVWSKITNHFS